MAELDPLIFAVEAALDNPELNTKTSNTLVERLADDHGASYRFSAGTHLFRMGGIGVSATSGYRAAVEYWLRKARAKAQSKAS